MSQDPAILLFGEPSAESDPFDDLLAESVAIVKQKTETKAASDRLKRGGQSSAEKLADLARIRAWEAAHDWATASIVATFVINTCTCGRQVCLPTGIMLKQVGRRNATAIRWIRPSPAELEEAEKALKEREMYAREQMSTYCIQCADGQGFPEEYSEF